MSVLEIKDLHVNVDDKEIIKGLSLKLESGTVNALMGPNGSGKSTLANTIMGHPKYNITKGKIIFNGLDITEMETDQRAKLGVFLSFQYPKEIAGITLSSFLRSSLNSVKTEKLSLGGFQKLLTDKMKILGVDHKFVSRYVNDGLSGGEKKKSEILQLAMLDPKLAILDETDSGLDIDALRVVSSGVNSFMNKEKCILIITHYKRILEYIRPDKLFIIIDGKIAMEGNSELVDTLEQKGYGWIEKD